MKSIALLYVILFMNGHHINKVHARNQDFVDNDTNTDETPSLVGTPNHPYVGIPIGTWKITDTSINERESLCQQQQEFCTTECGGDKLVEKNFCSRDTMGWICKCQNHVPDIPPYKWPIVLSECRGRENSCIEGCTYAATKGICVKACNNYFKCNKPGSPLSGLSIENEDQTPSYSLPAGRSARVINSSHSLSPPCLTSNCKKIMICYIVMPIFYVMVMLSLD